MAQKQPGQKGHGERFDQPVDAQRHAQAGALLIDLTNRAKVDLHQHGDDHHPDQQSHRDIHLSNFQSAHRLRCFGGEQAEQGAADNAEKYPERQVTLEQTERRAGLRGGGF